MRVNPAGEKDMQHSEFMEKSGIECDLNEYAFIETVYLNMPSSVIGFNATDFCAWIRRNGIGLDFLIDTFGPIAAAMTEKDEVIERQAREKRELVEERDLNAMAYDDLKRRYDTVVEVVGADRIREAVTASMDLDTLVDLRGRRGF